MKLDGISFLVLDDEAEIRDIISFCLTRAGAQVTEVENGSSALAIASERSFDVILSDIRIPGKDEDGITFLIRLKGTVKELPIFILMSGYADIHLEEAKKLGAADLIDKPFSMDTLLSRLSKLLSL